MINTYVIMLSIYEKVEEMGVDLFLKKPQRIRDSYLYECPPDELTCFFFFMNIDDFKTCFSSTAIYECFKKIPAEHMITLCKEMDARSFDNKYMSQFMSRSTFCKKWNQLKPSVVIYEFSEIAECLYGLLTSQFISYSDLYPSFKEYPMSYVSSMYQEHKLCKTLFRPLLLQFIYLFQRYHVPKDIVLYYIIPFLFGYDKK